MFRLNIAGFGSLRIAHLVLDYNGTLALDGRLLPGVRRRLARLARLMHIHVVTADTFGTARKGLRGLDCAVVVLDAARQNRAKREYVRRLGAGATAAIGNGRNDRAMLRAARVAIAVVQQEGACAEALAAADLVVPSVAAALDLFLHPLRLKASLRS